MASALNDVLQDRVNELARSRGISPDALLNEAVQSFVEREEVRQDFLREAEESLRDYRSTGEHLAGDDLRTWLRSWGSQDELPTPRCRA